MIGQAAVGKTSMLNKFKDENFKIKNGTLATVGIDQTAVYMKIND